MPATANAQTSGSITKKCRWQACYLRGIDHVSNRATENVVEQNVCCSTTNFHAARLLGDVVMAPVMASVRRSRLASWQKNAFVRAMPPQMHGQDVKRFNNKSMPATTATLHLDDIKRLFGTCTPRTKRGAFGRKVWSMVPLAANIFATATQKSAAPSTPPLSKKREGKPHSDASRREKPCTGICFCGS